MARLQSESHQSDGITVRQNQQRLLQQNLPKADITAMQRGDSATEVFAETELRSELVVCAHAHEVAVNPKRTRHKT